MTRRYPLVPIAIVDDDLRHAGRTAYVTGLLGA
jgi:hypothetical protein